MVRRALERRPLRVPRAPGGRGVGASRRDRGEVHPARAVGPCGRVWRPLRIRAIAVAWIAARPRPMRLMRTADLQLGLKERLSTAWERRLEDGPMDAMLRRDALEKAARARLAAAYPVGLRRGEVMLTAAVAIAAV